MCRYLLVVYHTKLRKLRASKSVKANSPLRPAKCIYHSLMVCERRTPFTVIYINGARIVSRLRHYAVSPQIDTDTSIIIGTNVFVRGANVGLMDGWTDFYQRDASKASGRNFEVYAHIQAHHARKVSKGMMHVYHRKLTTHTRVSVTSLC